MTYYRTRHSLSIGNRRIKSGEIVRLELPDENIRALLAVEAIAEISGPSLINVPEITDAQREALAEIGIGTLHEFLNIRSANIQTLMEMDEGAIRELKQALISQYLIIKEDDCLSC